MDQSELSSLSVLVVDDSRFFVELMRVMLRAFGIRSMYHAPSGDAALEIMAERGADILYVDCLMPVMDGIELVRRIRADESLLCRGVPIVCVSTHSVRSMVEAAVRSGADGFLAKPVAASDLFANLVKQIDRPLPRVSLDGYYGPDCRRGFEPASHAPERPARRSSPGQNAGAV